MKILRLSLLLLVTKVLAAKNHVESKGPFRTILVSVRPCYNTTYPLEKDPQVQVNTWITNSGTPRVKLLHGNVTVVKETKQIRIKIKNYAWEDGKWKLTYMMNSITCRGLLLDVLSHVIDLKMFDTSRCAFLKGTYSFNGLNINTIHHMIASSAQYGQTLWVSEMNVGFSTYYCWEALTMVKRV